MPLALLLSPDDQAVSAITGVLEEMSVSCERPMDGASAAQKLNSRSFDFVLVDCENLPAAKLIFDVCRRGKNNNSPVPIAIVDGRAGLPTAFRLGAELILTKPVARDQARSTIRMALSRLRKEDPARAAPAPHTASIPAVAPTPPPAPPSHERALAAAAAVSAQPVKISAPTPAVPANLPAAPVMRAVPEVIPVPPVVPPVPAAPSPKPASLPKSTTAEDLFETPKPTPPPKPAPPVKPSDDPVMAELERSEVEPSPAPVFSSYEVDPPRGRGPLMVVMFLALFGGAIYAAWMYQPAFRALVQPQVDRVLALAGIAPQRKVSPGPPTPEPGAAPTLAKPTPAIAASPVTSPADAAQPDNASAAADSPEAAPVSIKATAQTESPAENTEAESSSPDGEVSGDKGTVILSSKGAEKRLLRHVPPTLPATAQGLEGTVILKTMVDDRGKVESVSLVEGNPALAEAATQAVKQWRYRPYVRDGKSLPFQTVVLVDFQRP